jgi:NADH-quinone oxidoreductase subunit G
VLRRLAGDDPEVNEEWNCDKGRWAFTYPHQGDRIATPLVRDADGSQRPASWSEAVAVAIRGLTAADGRAGVLVGGRSTLEDAYAYAKFARIVLGTNDVDFRSRAHSDEEAQFMAAAVAGQPMAVTYADLEAAPAVLLAGFEPEEESPIVYLRLRKAFRKRGLKVRSIAPFATRGLEKMGGTLIATAPGGEAAAMDSLRDDDLLGLPGAVILVGERLATSPGAYTAALRLAEASGARLGWIPRRAGERGAVEAGAAPNLLPGGRPLSDATARAEVAAAWNVDELPAQPGRDTSAIIAAAAEGALGALLVGGVEVADLPDPAAAMAGIDAAPFVVSLELRHSAVTERADVVFPVAPVTEKSGTFVDWEGRKRSFEPALPPSATSDSRVLAALAEEVGVDLGLRDAAAARDELRRLGAWQGTPAAAPDVAAPEPEQPEAGLAVLAGWRMLLDMGRLQDGEPHLAGTARPSVARLSRKTAAEIGAEDGGPITVATPRGAITLALEITEMPDRVVWLPLNSPRSQVNPSLGAAPGDVVAISVGGELA